MRNALPAAWRGVSGPMAAMCLLLAAAFLLGGGARGDLQSLILLRPLAAILLVYGLARITREQVRANLPALAIAAAGVGLLALHLVPLPPGWWTVLPGRELVMQLDSVAGLGPVWRPLSLTPAASLNALYAALVPCAALVIGIQLAAEERRRLLVPILLLGGISAVLSVLQIFGDANGLLYFYRITNNGEAVGLFANRNHQAFLLALLLPMLAVWSAERSSGKTQARMALLTAGLAGMVLLPLILITGSRGGMALAMAALLSLAILLPRRPSAAVARKDRAIGRAAVLRKLLAGMAVAAGAGALAWLTITRGRGLAWERLFEEGQTEEMRLLMLPTVMDMIITHLPLGSGFGSFERIYQVYETDDLLRPTYANHAHNDWLELALTGGVPALILLAAVILAALFRARALFSSAHAAAANLRLARLGLTVVLLLALASLSDYPLRVPSIACLFIVAVLWMSCPLSKNPPTGEQS